MVQISVVDMSKLGLDKENPSTEEYAEVGQNLHDAFSKIGFVYLKNFGIHPEVIESAFSVSQKFFIQAEEEKEKISRVDQQGWVAQGREIFDQAEDGSIAIMEIREAFDINKLDKDARFPDENLPEFRKNLYDLAKLTINLANRILRALSIQVGKEADFFEKLHRRILVDENASAMRSLYYPAVQGELQPGHIRCGEHSDYGTFTLLYQDSYPGLQVKASTGEWVEALPMKDAVLVNIGDLLEMWTAGLYPATLHRVLIPEEETKKCAARQSIVFFVHPDDEVIVSPITECSLFQGRDFSSFPDVSALDHVTKRFQQTYKY